MSRLVEQASKFSLVGVLAFVLDYAVLMLLTFHTGLSAVEAAGISFIVANLFTYFVSMRYVFTHRKDMSRMREFVMFGMLLLIGMLLNEVIVELFVRLAGTTRLSVSAAKIVSSFAVTVWNFYSRRRWLDGSEQA